MFVSLPPAEDHAHGGKRVQLHDGPGAVQRGLRKGQAGKQAPGLLRSKDSGRALSCQRILKNLADKAAVGSFVGHAGGVAVQHQPVQVGDPQQIEPGMEHHFTEQLLLKGGIQRRIDALGAGGQIVVDLGRTIGAGNDRVLSQADRFADDLLHLGDGGVQELLAALAQTARQPH